MNTTTVASTTTRKIGRYRLTISSSTAKPNTSTKTKSAVNYTSKHPPFSSSLSFAGRLWDGYTEQLIARPLIVKCGTAAIIFFLSDAATQKFLHGIKGDDDDDELIQNMEVINKNDGNNGDGVKEKWVWDLKRSFSGALFGSIATFWLHYWWGFLEFCVNKRLPISKYDKFVNTLVKVSVDQLIGAPFYIYSYYCITHFGQEWMKTKSTISSDTCSCNDATQSDVDAIHLMNETSERAKQMLPTTLLRHWTLWPMVHTLNFYYNPIHHRTLVQNLVLTVWSGYLSYLNNGGLSTVSTPSNNKKSNNDFKLPSSVS